jgi:hypothetical protein
MIDTRAVGQELQDLQHQIVGRIRQGQQTVAGTIKTLAHTAQATRPQIPGLPVTALTDKLPKPEDLAARLPKPEALIAGAYDLAGQLLAAQRRLGGQVMHAAMPLARQGAAMIGQSVSPPARSAARTSRTAGTAKATKASTAGTSTKTVSAKPTTSAGGNRADTAKTRSAKK